MHVGGERVIETAEGNGPVNALDTALRRALGDRFPALDRVHLTDYKVRVLDTAQGHRRRHPGAHRLHQRRARLDDDRREREHHRGVVAGALRLARLRLLLLAERERARRDVPTDPFVAPHRSTTRPARSRTSRRASACRRRAPGRPIGPATSTVASHGRAARHARPERRVRAHARRTERATGSRSPPHEHLDDAEAVVGAVAMKRAASYGRAPVTADVECALARARLPGRRRSRLRGLANRRGPRRRARLPRRRARSSTRSRSTSCGWCPGPGAPRGRGARAPP